MIDETKQGKGYGRQALMYVPDYIKTKPFGESDRIALTCNKTNTAALSLYRQMGFAETGICDDEEYEMVLYTEQW